MPKVIGKANRTERKGKLKTLNCAKEARMVESESFGRYALQSSTAYDSRQEYGTVLELVEDDWFFC